MPSGLSSPRSRPPVLPDLGERAAFVAGQRVGRVRRRRRPPLRRLVRLEVERAALSVREASERFEARRKEQEASGENLRLARERYKVGAGDIIEMVDAQVQMTRAETAVIEALYDSSISAATLLRAVGR